MSNPDEYKLYYWLIWSFHCDLSLKLLNRNKFCEIKPNLLEKKKAFTGNLPSDVKSEGFKITVQ